MRAVELVGQRGGIEAQLVEQDGVELGSTAPIEMCLPSLVS